MTSLRFHSSILRLQAAWQSLRKPIDPALARARQRYLALAPRERRLVTGAGALLGAAVVFVTLIEPPLNTMRKLQAELPVLRGQAATVADLTTQARTLRQRSAAPSASMPSPPNSARAWSARGCPRACGRWRKRNPEPACN
ncbi:type II secretion system protein GspM [Achromobacter kerstersii]